MITSKVAFYGEVPTLFINEKPVSALAYMTYFDEYSKHKQFYDCGYRLFSLTVYFGNQTINATSGIHPFEPGIFSIKDKTDYGMVDNKIEKLLSSCPEAFIFLRVNISPPSWWEDENPDELNDIGYNGGRRRVSLSSKKWLGYADECLMQFIEHINHSSYREHIIGYQLAAGNTEEWLPFDMKGSIGKALRESYNEKYGDYDEIRFRSHISESVADSICFLAASVKKKVDRKLIVGTFYGYTFETPWWQSGHMALKRLLQSKDIDFLCSPSSYANMRATGYDLSCMTLLDSVKHHGKLYFVECDTRTYLSDYPFKSRPECCEENTYNTAIWKGPADRETSIGQLRANFARQITHGNALWWFDMWGGWFNDDKIMEDMAAYKEIADRAMDDALRRSIAEVAVITDENCMIYSDDRELCIKVLYSNRNPLGLFGAPYDVYDVSDFEDIKNYYKVFIILVPCLTTAIKEMIQSLDANRNIYFLADENSPVLTVNDLRQVAKHGGVHLYIDTEDVLYAGENYISIHAHTDGEKQVILKTKRLVIPLFSDEKPFLTDKIYIHMKKGETLMWRT